ncbi:putative disease resistance protein [Trifolium repens]|nr:putative disease resistance protein [Trifolium repens]
MDIVISIAAKISEFTIAPIGRQFGYILYYKGNLKRMKKDFKKMEGMKDVVQHKVNEARRNGEEIEIIVQNWLNEVDNTVVEAKKLIDTEGHAKAHCSMGHFPNLFTRHQLSRKTKKMSQEISQVLAEGKFDTISYRVPAQVTVTPFGRGYEALDSRTSVLNDIMMELKNPNNSIIGVYGMGGVGKTKLVEQLVWQAEKDRLFSVVAIANITDSPNLEKIQDKIADDLDMKFNMQTKEGRAMQLRQRISNEKSILIILDDIWGKLDLTEVGIPFGDDHKGCKLVVTSRDLNVLNREMGTQKEFRLEVLLEEDSWKLFEKMAGEVVQEFNIKPIAIEVARHCAGLPLLIVIVAKALRKKHVVDWKDALNKLKRSDEEGLPNKVYTSLELSYNFLESEELKLLFLFIGSFGLDLLYTGPLFTRYWGSGLYRHSLTLTDARTRYYKLINDLKASSLLLESKPELIRIHDVVRDVAKSISSIGLDQPMACQGDYLKVPDDFFSEMGALKVISLHGMMLTPSPPPSLCLFTKIQSLEMTGCVLEDISIVAKLKSLEILSLERSDIKELPKEIGQLTNLRMLNLTNCSGLRFIPANPISSLTCLEKLYMGNCFINWVVKGSKYQSNNASIDELGNLSHLTTLDIMIQDASVLPHDLQVFAKLERYNIYVGDRWKWPLVLSGHASETSRNLKLTDNKSPSIFLDRGFNFLLNSAENMWLNDIQCVRNVLYDLNRKGFPQVKHLCIQNTSLPSTELNKENSIGLQYIVNSMGLVYADPALPNLETLSLQNLFSLEEICHGPVPIHSFTKLKSFEVKGCHKLTNLLWYSLVRDLPQLLDIKIYDCKMITDVIVFQISEVDIEINKIMFPKLRCLELEHLPNLISFCSVPLAADKHLKKCGENYDDTQCIPVSLIDQKVEMPHLELLKLSNINSRKLWDDNLPGHSFIQNLTSLTIDECVNIVYAFSSSVARDLVVFPSLETLEISHMEHLKSLWHNQLAPNSFCKLKQLTIQSCNKISNVFPSYVLDKLHNLEKLTITDCPALEVVFKTQSLQVECKSLMFSNLGQLKLTECKSLKYVFPLSVAKELQHLQELCIIECGVESIVARDEMVDTSSIPILIFPVLKSLMFRDLTQLQNFYHGLHTLDCPVLSDVDVFHCDKLVLFEPMSLNYQDNVTVDILPLLSIEKVVSNTSKLILNCKDVNMLCNGQLNDEPVYKVKDLSLRCFHDVCDKFPSDFLQRFINLDNLELSCSSFTEVLLNESFGTGHSEATMKLRRLKLDGLPNLKFICREKSEVQLVLQNMEYLFVYLCSTLKTVFPSSVVFENLQELKVFNCAGLENILKSSTATSLQKLRKLHIYGCEIIEEIVASDDENDTSELAFMKLTTLMLSNLPRLRSFCKGRHDFKFPLLYYLVVKDCPMMETFSHGVLNVPRLGEVRVNLKEQDEWHWNGDLNATIRKYVAKNEL